MDKFPLEVPINRARERESRWYVKRALDKLRPGLTMDSKGRLSFDPFQSMTPPASEKKSAEKTNKWRLLGDPPKKEGPYVIRRVVGGSKWVRTFDGVGWLSVHDEYFSGTTLEKYEWCEHE